MPKVMRTNVHELLCEALRRFECFAERRDRLEWTLENLESAWTGLGNVRAYKSVFPEYMTYAATPNKWHDCWWKLTPEGAKIVLAWHKAGYGCGGNMYHLVTAPPKEFPEETHG